MELLSSISACSPLLPTKAAPALTLRSPPSMTLEVQAERLPDSKPSAKIRSVTCGVLVGVGEGPGVNVGVGVFVLTGGWLGKGVPEAEILISHTLPSFSLESELLSTPRLAI